MCRTCSVKQIANMLYNIDTNRKPRHQEQVAY